MAKEKITREQALRKTMALIEDNWTIPDKVYELAQDVWQKATHAITDKYDITDWDLDSDEEWYDEFISELFSTSYLAILSACDKYLNG